MHDNAWAGGLAIGTLAVINGLWATNQFPNR